MPDTTGPETERGRSVPSALDVVAERGECRRPDQALLATYSWRPADTGGRRPRGAVYLAHGMAEHAGRYEEFARFLVGRGYLVHAHDHRGHGLTATGNGRREQLGYVAHSGGWELLIGDLLARMTQVQRQEPDLPLVLVGHSMGSFLSRDVAIRLSRARRHFARGVRRILPPIDVAAYVFMGSGGPEGLILDVGLAAVGLAGRVMGSAWPNPITDKAIFGRYNRAFAPARTEYDWLSRDPAAVDAYVADLLCGFVCATSFYRDLFEGSARVNTPGYVAHLDADASILFVAGAADGVGADGIGVRRAAAQVRDAGVRDVTWVLYRDARHELLHETNRIQVMRAIADWLDVRMSADGR